MKEPIEAWLAARGLTLPEFLLGHTSIVFVGFSACIVFALWFASRDGLSLWRSMLAVVGALAGAIIGSKAFGYLLHGDECLSDPAGLLTRDVGAVSFGALIGGVVAFWAYLAKHGESPWRYADAMAPAAGVGLGMARLGCLSNGCDYGRMTDWAWGIRYPADSGAFRGQLRNGFVGEYQIESLPVHPFPLVLACWSLTVFAVFWAFPGLGRGADGERAVLAGALYFGGRFLIEFMRSPWSSQMVGFLNLAQWLCVGSLVALWSLRQRLRAVAAGSQVTAS